MAPPLLDVPSTLASFSGVVPVFPLPSLVLLPDTIVPLNIFEDRYRKMTKDALEGERLIAIALLKPGWETQYEGNPPYHERVCLGRILNHDLLPDGRYRALLYGFARADVIEEVQSSPYRTARVAPVGDEEHPSQARDLDERLHRALEMLPGRRGYVGRLRRLAADVRGPAPGTGGLADAVADAAGLEADERLRVLGESDVLRRVDLVIALLEHRARSGPDRLPERRDPSLN